MIRTVRKVVGAAPVCPPEHPRSGVSMRKGHVPTRKEGISIHKRCMLTPKHVCVFADGCALMGRRGRAHRHRPYQPPSRPSTTQSSLILCIGELFSGNFMIRTIREMVGAAPVCPPERPRSDVSMHKRHVPTRKGDVSICKGRVPTRKGGVSMRKRHVPTRKGGVSIHKRCMLTPKHVYALR